MATVDLPNTGLPLPRESDINSSLSYRKNLTELNPGPLSLIGRTFTFGSTDQIVNGWGNEQTITFIASIAVGFFLWNSRFTMHVPIQLQARNAKFLATAALPFSFIYREYRCTTGRTVLHNIADKMINFSASDVGGGGGGSGSFPISSSAASSSRRSLALNPLLTAETDDDDDDGMPSTASIAPSRLLRSARLPTDPDQQLIDEFNALNIDEKQYVIKLVGDSKPWALARFMIYYQDEIDLRTQEKSKNKEFAFATAIEALSKIPDPVRDSGKNERSRLKLWDDLFKWIPRSKANELEIRYLTAMFEANESKVASGLQPRSLFVHNDVCGTPMKWPLLSLFRKFWTRINSNAASSRSFTTEARNHEIVRFLGACHSFGVKNNMSMSLETDCAGLPEELYSHFKERVEQLAAHQYLLSQFESSSTTASMLPADGLTATSGPEFGGSLLDGSFEISYARFLKILESEEEYQKLLSGTLITKDNKGKFPPAETRSSLTTTTPTYHTPQRRQIWSTDDSLHKDELEELNRAHECELKEIAGEVARITLSTDLNALKKEFEAIHHQTPSVFSTHIAQVLEARVKWLQDEESRKLKEIDAVASMTFEQVQRELQGFDESKAYLFRPLNSRRNALEQAMVQLIDRINSMGEAELDQVENPDQNKDITQAVNHRRLFLKLEKRLGELELIVSCVNEMALVEQQKEKLANQEVLDAEWNGLNDNLCKKYLEALSRKTKELTDAMNGRIARHNESEDKAQLEALLALKEDEEGYVAEPGERRAIEDRLAVLNRSASEEESGDGDE